MKLYYFTAFVEKTSRVRRFLQPPPVSCDTCHYTVLLVEELEPPVVIEIPEVRHCLGETPLA